MKNFALCVHTCYYKRLWALNNYFVIECCYSVSTSESALVFAKIEYCQQMAAKTSLAQQGLSHTGPCHDYPANKHGGGCPFCVHAHGAVH